MQKIDLYRQYARQAVETAEIATSKYEKADLLEIAEAWQQLANSIVSVKRTGHKKEAAH